jgi:uncharacterized protein YbgA (DUF1722 family)/uncharacterized protein YbbK (DUF523 family)
VSVLQPPPTGSAQGRPRLGVSSCLLGQRVRYDGGHKRDRFLTDTLGRFVEWVPVCPEVECGLPVPREAMRLEGGPEHPRLVAIKTRRDLTQQMVLWARERVVELEGEDLCGFIFKSRSPSSGMTRVPIHDRNGVPTGSGVGVFAREFMEHFPLLPVEDEGRLHDPGLRENFVERVFCLRRYRDAVRRDGAGRLVEFHADHKVQLVAHSPSLAGEMGRLVARAGVRGAESLLPTYDRLLMEALRRRATVGTNSNALQHMMGHFKRVLSGDEKQELLETIERYRTGYLPLIVPITLIAHYVRKYHVQYLERQSYLNPHPIEIGLRNHA